MNIKLRVVELLGDGEIRGRGDFEFNTTPSQNDRIALAGPIDLEIMRVAYIEHTPVKLPKIDETEDMEPCTMVYVEFESR